VLDGALFGGVRAVDLAPAPAVAEALRLGPVDCHVLVVSCSEGVWAAVPGS
jgi:hypothetical protein